MRLTLRTLLAYLDDVLSPADTKLIGQKIQESPMAQLLVSRIREVMRKRRLKSPEVFGPEMGMDPNIVAQYLDSTLPANRYADVERVLLASDEMLAEAAACHQVLTLTLANPTEVPQSSRDRLYALGPVEPSSQLKSSDTGPAISKRTPMSIAVRNGSPQSQMTRPAIDDDERITTLPDYLKPAPWPQRILPTGIIALLVIVCAAVLAPGFMTGIRKASDEIQKKVDRSKTDVASTSPDSNELPVVADADLDSAMPGANAAANGEGIVAARIPNGIDPNPPADVAEGGSPLPKPNAEEMDLTGDSFVPPKPSDIAMPTPANNARPAASEVPVVPAGPPVTYNSTEGVLVRYNEQSNHWFLTPHRTAVNAGEIVANPEPFDAILDFEKSGIRTILIGESVVKILSPAEVKLRGLGIGRGRILIQVNHLEDVQGGSIGIAIGEDLWKLELLTAETICGIEVAVRESTQFQKLNDFHWYQASLYTLSGAARWTNAEGASIEIADHMGLTIVPERALASRTPPVKLLTSPAWCDPLKRKAMPLRRYQSPFERSFDPDKPVDQSMLTLVKTTKNAKIAELGARCLSAIDNYAGLVDTLSQSESSKFDARFAARNGLRQWLPMGLDHGARLKAELELIYPPADAEAVYKMLWGFSRDDVKNSKVTSLQFTTWMRSPRLEIRELADYWVRRLTDRHLEYNALEPKESHIRRIEEWIERDNGLIKGP